MRRVTSWLHVWLESGRRELNPCRMVPSKRDEVREARTAAMTSRERCAAVNCRAGAQVASCRAGDVQLEKKKLSKSSLATSGEQESQAGVEDLLAGAQDTTS